MTLVEPGAVRAALAAAARVGPFFRLEAVDAARAAGWLPVSALSYAELASLTEHTARQLGTGEPRVAASIAHLGLAARLWSPVLASGLLCGLVPDLSGLVVAADPPVRLGLDRPAGSVAGSPGQLATLSAGAVAPRLTALAAGLAVRLPAGLQRGNSASAMTGALRVIVGHDRRLAAPASELARILLDSDDLLGTGTLTDADPLAFRRRSCCLYYRVPGGGLCGDCCFASRPRSRD